MSTFVFNIIYTFVQPSSLFNGIDFIACTNQDELSSWKMFSSNTRADQEMCKVDQCPKY